jgi:hypothetical protein
MFTTMPVIRQLFGIVGEELFESHHRNSEMLGATVESIALVAYNPSDFCAFFGFVHAVPPDGVAVLVKVPNV